MTTRARPVGPERSGTPNRDAMWAALRVVLDWQRPTHEGRGGHEHA